MTRATYRIVNDMQSGNQDVYLYGEIGAWGVTADQFRRDLGGLDKAKGINLHIHSGGGEVFEGLAIHSLLSAWPAGVSVTIDGLAASMASVVALSGKPTRMVRNGWMMIHNPVGECYGGSDDLLKTAALLDGIRDSMADAYARKANGKKSADDFREMMAAETWMTAEQAHECGLVDEVIDAVDVAASVSRVAGGAVPEAVRAWIEQPEGTTDATDAAAVTVQDADHGDASAAADAGTVTTAAGNPSLKAADEAWQAGYDAATVAVRDAARVAIAAEYESQVQARESAWAEERDEYEAQITAALAFADECEAERDDHDRQSNARLAAQAAEIARANASLAALRIGLRAPSCDPEAEPQTFPAAVSRLTATGMTPEQAHVEARRRWPDLHTRYIADAQK